MKILKVIIGAFLFIACVFVATANMHVVQLVLPDVPVSGWPHFEPINAPLFVVLLTTLFLGVLLVGLSTLLEQVRLRTVARRARKECERAQKMREEAAHARDVAEKEQVALRAQVEQLGAELATVRALCDQAQNESSGLRGERDTLRAELDRTRAAEVAPEGEQLA